MTVTIMEKENAIRRIMPNIILFNGYYAEPQLIKKTESNVL